MCDECYAKFMALEDIQLPCTKPDCEGTWTWNRFQQLEHQLGGRSADRPPRGLCDGCREEMRQGEDQEIPCRMKGCEKTWTWYRRDQLMCKDGKPPRRLCHDCFQALKSLEDREIPCRMKACEGTWTWNRFQQLEHQLAGKELDKPPKRMCRECYERFRDLQDREEPCRINECSRTWTYRAYDQLEHIIQEGPEAPPPERMCRDCYLFYSQAQDQEIRCRNRGCEGTWTYTKSAQLHAWLRGSERPPARMCEACTRTLEEMAEQQVGCMVPGCERTWTYEPADQLRDKLGGRAAPAARRCKDCDEFLASHETVTLACESCQAPIQWSGYEQLLHALGTFVKPTHCPACNEQKMQLQRPPEPKEREHHLVIRVPSAGRWHEDDLIRAWPPHMTPSTIAKAEKAAVRIVAFGDDLTHSADDHAETWSAILEQKLEERLGRSVCVVNSGIQGCTSYQGLLRLQRDVLPFEPHAVLFSFVFADAWLDARSGGDEFRGRYPLERVFADMNQLWQNLRRLPVPAVYWTPNPIFPENAGDEFGKPSPHWVRAQNERMDHVLRHARHCCIESDVKMADFHSRFTVNGMHSAQRWMKNWFCHNHAGAANIAAWLTDFLVNGGVLPND
jgi:lysophospholipase L1-like esterase